MSDIKPIAWNEDPAHFRRASRREFLYTGLIGGLGLTLGNYFKLRAAEATMTDPLKPVAQSIIHIYLPGGSAHQETWDPKPLAPIEYRGPLGTVETAIKGERFSEHMKQTAKIADKICVVRSMTHGDAAHERGTHNMFTGYKPSPAILYPSMGSVVSHELGSRNNLPPYVCVPSASNEFAGSGYLSTAFGPFSLGADPGQAKGFAVRDLNLHGGITPERFDRRRSILDTVDEHFRTMEKSDAISAMDSFYQSAYKLVSSPEARAAFDLTAEPEAIRSEYGQNTAGGRMLMARRLVEGGVRFVSVVFGGWDMHANISKGMEKQLPEFDQAYAALIRDLDRRGMLDSTLVMVSSEFGRSPKINKDAGRDHWPRVFSVAFAGGGFKRGLIYGASDPTGSEPDHDPLTVENMAATVFHQLGIRPDKNLMSPGNRPVSIVKNGQVMTDLLA